MFGMKIISEKEYFRLCELVERHTMSHNATSKQIGNLKSDIESLRQQLNERINEVEKLRQFKRDILDALSDIDLGGVRIKLCSQICDKCKEESNDCSKYEYGEHAFCVFRLNK